MRTWEKTKSCEMELYKSDVGSILGMVMNELGLGWTAWHWEPVKKIADCESMEAAKKAVEEAQWS